MKGQPIWQYLRNGGNLCGCVHGSFPRCALEVAIGRRTSVILATQHTGAERGNAEMVLALVHEDAGFSGVTCGVRGLGGG